MTNANKRTELLKNIRGAALLADKPSLATAVDLALEAEKEANRMQWVENVLNGVDPKHRLTLA